MKDNVNRFFWIFIIVVALALAVWGLNNLANSYLQRGDKSYTENNLEAALTMYDQALIIAVLPRTRTDILLAEAEVFSSQGDIGSEREVLDDILSYQPRNIKVLTRSAWLAGISGDYTQSFALYGRLSIVDENNQAEYMLSQADALLRDNRWEDYAEMVTRVEQLYPEDEGVSKRLELLQAVQALGLELNISTENVSQNLGFIEDYNLSGEYKSLRLAQIMDGEGERLLATKYLERYLGSSQGLRDGWLLLGKIHFSQGDNKKALISFEKALTLDPNNGFTHYLLGKSYEALGRDKEAEDSYSRAKALGYAR